MLMGTAGTSRAASLLSCACLTIGNVDGFLVFAPPVPAARAPPPPFPRRSSTCSPLALASSRESTADQRQRQRQGERTTYYDTLGVSEHSDITDIKRQYKRLARMTHPDALIGNDPSSSDATTNNQLPDFYEICTAYKVLSDPQKRKKYDRELAADQFVEGTAELAESVGATLGGFVVPFVAKTAKATVKAAAKTATVVKNTSDQVQENLRKAREEEAERRRQQRLEEERLRAEINEKMRRREEERLRLEAERAERERLDRIAEDQKMEAERIATESAQKAEEKQAKQQSELEKKFLQLQAEEMLEKKTTAQRSQTISLSSAAVVDEDSGYSLDKAIQVSKDEHSGGPRSKITKPSSRRKRVTATPEKNGPSTSDVEQEPYDLETALQMSKEPRNFGSKKSTTARRTKKNKRKKGKNNKKRKR